MAWFTCTVNAAGPASDPTDTPQPAIYINLTHVPLPPEGPKFTNQWFYAADNSKQQMLAVALGAMTLGSKVQMAVQPDAPAEFTRIDRLYLQT